MKASTRGPHRSKRLPPSSSRRASRSQHKSSSAESARRTRVNRDGRMRHSALVRTTHWVTAASVFALLASGGAILLAHPRLYWGEAGALGAPSIVDLPLPFVL